jgi:glycosyltransferase involved in cell wall biosynthesis
MGFENEDSRIGGLPFTSVGGVTGLLCEPCDRDDLAPKLDVLLDQADLRQRKGLAGRRHFEHVFTWDVAIEKDYCQSVVKYIARMPSLNVSH